MPLPLPPRLNIEAERAAIDSLVEQYVQAYQSLDDTRVRRIDPGFRPLDPRTKPLLRGVQVRVTGRSLQVAEDGQTASLTATQNVTYDWQRAGLQKTATIPLSWNLRKEGNEWRVCTVARGGRQEPTPSPVDASEHVVESDDRRGLGLQASLLIGTSRVTFRRNVPARLNLPPTTPRSCVRFPR